MSAVAKAKIEPAKFDWLVRADRIAGEIALLACRTVARGNAAHLRQGFGGHSYA